MIYETYPCPMCGHKVATIGKDKDGRFHVECAGCGLRTEGRNSVREATGAWNNRRYGQWRQCTECQTRRLATWNPEGKYAMRCSRCQRVLAKKFAEQYEWCPHCGARMNKDPEYTGIGVEKINAEEENVLSRE